MVSNLDIMISEYKKLYEQKKLLHLLKTGKELKRKEFHKILVYLAGLIDVYRYSESKNCFKDNYDTVSIIHFSKSSYDVESLLSDAFKRFVPMSSPLQTLELDPKSYTYSKEAVVCRFYYERKSIDWGYMDAELMTNHSFNIKIHSTNKLPYIKDFHLKWWEQQQLKLNENAIQ